MATPIVPHVVADEVVLQQVNVEYKPEWDGAAWVLTPANIIVRGYGILDDATVGQPIETSNVNIPATDLPAAGQTALQELYGYIEAQMAALYT